MTGINNRYMLADIVHFSNKIAFIESGIQRGSFSKSCFIILNQMNRSFQRFAISWLKQFLYYQLIANHSTLERISIHIFQHDCKISFSEIILYHAWIYNHTSSFLSQLQQQL